MKSYKPSRILNESSVFMGLTINDLIGLSLVFVFFLVVLKPFNKQLWSFSITACAMILLSPIRINYRKKIIRDTFQYFLGDRVARIKSNRRNKRS